MDKGLLMHTGLPMRHWLSVAMLVWVAGYSTASLADQATMMPDNAKSMQKMSSMGEAKSSATGMQNQMQMSKAEREQYLQQLKACEREGRSAKECEAKIMRKMHQGQEMHDSKQQGKNKAMMPAAN